MKIANYIPTASFFVGGGERVPLEQTKYLKNLGLDISLITLKTKKETDIFKNFKKENPDIPIIYLHPTQIIANFENVELTHEFCHKLYLALTREANSIMSEGNYDVVITHYAPGVFSIPSYIHQVLFLHGVPKEYQEINNVALNHVEKLIAVSRSVKEGWAKLFNYKGAIEVINNGIDTEKFWTSQKQKNNIDLLYVGRLIKIKGVQDLIKSIDIINKRSKGLINSVHIIGTGPYKSELEKLTNSLKLESIINFEGYVEDSNLLDFYKKSKVCVFPSYAKEGVLTTLLEASSFGKTVITSNSCGMKDLVKDGFNGLLFEPRNIQNLADKIEIALKDKELQKELSENARREIVANWSWESSAEKLLKSIQNSYEDK